MASVMNTIFKTATTVHVAIFRRSNGRLWKSMKGLPVALLTVNGRKTGTPRTTPVTFIRHGEAYVVAGSAGGADWEPQWFRNLRHADRASVQVGAESTPVLVRIAEGAERDALYAELVKAGPHFGDYQKKTERTIPVAVLTPSP